MRDYKADFEDTCKLMRRYMKHIQPQRFASVWGIFEKQKKQCELNKISIDDVSDIYNYAKVEQIEKFGFWVDYVVGNTYKVKYVEAKTNTEAIKKAKVKNIVDLNPVDETK